MELWDERFLQIYLQYYQDRRKKVFTSTEEKFKVEQKAKIDGFKIEQKIRRFVINSYLEDCIERFNEQVRLMRENPEDYKVEEY